MNILNDQIALVAGATRGAGRGIAIELALAGAIVYVTGRTARGHPSPMRRPETIEETAELISAAGGVAVPVRVDHTVAAEVEALMERIDREQDGRLDILVNDVWGGDPLISWGVPFWEQTLDTGLLLQNQALHSHIITSWYAAPRMAERRSGLIVEVTDGIVDRFRGTLYYDLVKAGVIRLALGQAEELRPFNVASVALSPGFLRSEAMLDHFGVKESNWRDGIDKDPNFAVSETPRFIGRAVVALAADPKIMIRSGHALATWNLAREYGFVDIDGSRPDWGAHARRELGIDMG